jgi:hypothetical protein
MDRNSDTLAGVDAALLGTTPAWPDYLRDEAAK